MKEEGCLVAFDRADPLHFASSRCTHFDADLSRILRMPAVVAICAYSALLQLAHYHEHAYCFDAQGCATFRESGSCLAALLDTATRHTFLVSCDPFILHAVHSWLPFAHR
jgi:hypothetical protein